MKSPRLYAMEVTNYCNGQCEWCPHSRMKRSFGLVQMETVRKVVEYCSSIGQDYIALHHMGEPLIHPHLVEIINMLEDAGIRTELSTNGKLLYKHGLELLESKITRIRIAVDKGYSQAHYKTFLKYFLVNASHKDVEVRLHTMFDNDLSVFEGRGDNIIIEKKCFDNWAGAVDGDSTLPTGNGCYFLKYNYVVMLWDGRIVPCCMDYDAVDVLGTIDNIKKIKKITCSLCDNCAQMQFASGGGWKI